MIFFFRLFSPNFHCLCNQAVAVKMEIIVTGAQREEREKLSTPRSSPCTTLQHRLRLSAHAHQRYNRDLRIKEQFVYVTPDKALQIAPYNLAIYIFPIKFSQHVRAAAFSTTPAWLHKIGEINSQRTGPKSEARKNLKF